MKTQGFAATAVLLAAIGTTGLAVGAEPGPYIGLQGAATFQREADNSGTNLHTTSKFTSGYNVAGVLGWNYGQNWRAEAELGYRRNDLDKLAVDKATGTGLAGGQTYDAHGHVGTTDVMGNLWYDVDTGSRWKPYVGGGIGWAHINANNVSANGVSLADDTSNVFAYQLGAGIGYELTRRTTVSVNYRYFATKDPTFTNVATGTKFNSQYRTNNVGLSLRYRF
ncbi:MAG: outer membrane beta-barrel protein [Gammaproteobacteria bacterium]